ncbi:MAG: hypothetical protein HC847_25575 [Hydrococcus sp. RU_2_2]|nr:hypothetical protein [Hydrococcus sp. RU_2_2]NJP21894.1 hypothetical protein [Hydrococcus sp. CRU_1_1]NJQ96959.1 hypothetical protein [Hydrococcus sp. CSU_1_8]
MLKNMTIEELKCLYEYYCSQYPQANEQGKTILWHYMRRLRRRIRRLGKKSIPQAVEVQS